MGKKGGNKSQRQRKKAFGWDTKGGAPARGPSIKLDSGAAALGSRAGGHPGLGPTVPSPPRWGRGCGAAGRGQVEPGGGAGPLRAAPGWGHGEAGGSGGCWRPPRGIPGSGTHGYARRNWSGRRRRRAAVRRGLVSRFWALPALRGNRNLCPGSSRPTVAGGGVAVLDSGPKRHPAEVAGLSAGSGTHPDGLHVPFPEASVCGTCSPRCGGSGVYSRECSPSHSGSTCLNLHKPCEDWPCSVLKTSTTILMQKSLSAEKYGIQRGRLPAPSPEEGVPDTGGGGAGGGGGVPRTWKPGRSRAIEWETRGPGPWRRAAGAGPTLTTQCVRIIRCNPDPQAPLSLTREGTRKRF